MRSSIIEKVLLVGACMLVAVTAWGQQSPKPASWKPSSIDLALTYSPERGQTAIADGNFWMQGAGLDLAATYKNHWGLSAAINGEHAGNVTPSLDVNKITYLAGPRYTADVFTGKNGFWKGRTVQLFGEGLFGAAHAFASVIPSSSGVINSTNVFAVQVGGGVNVSINKRFGLRLLQVDYVRTALPNNTTNEQDDLHLGFGAVCHFGSR